jgi:hypothetical protein
MRNVWFYSLTHFLSIFVQDTCKSTIESVEPHVGSTYSMVEFKKIKKKCAKELHRTHLIPDTTILMNKTQSSITNKIHHCS